MYTKEKLISNFNQLPALAPDQPFPIEYLRVFIAADKNSVINSINRALTELKAYYPGFIINVNENTKKPENCFIERFFKDKRQKALQ